ncbi:hypothetical protein [Rheinheimera aquimaris]|uniref:hypothetical protein n=1 Tax=Rheinheimera aquimaris TaxID=412437 RepID=UPI001064E550|nr:hypothetical protein [Rheinheimera aquimaris]
MKTTFKKTLVASAILAFAGAANAAVTNQVDPTPLSAQGVGATVTAGDVNVVLKAEYAVGDTITFKFPGASFHSSNAPSLVGLTNTGAAAIANALTDPAGTAVDGDFKDLSAGITFGLLSASGDTATFRITELNSATVPTTVNGLIRLSGVVFTGASVAAAKDVSVVYSAQTSTGVAIDTATTNTGKLIAVKDQYSLTVGTKADAVIDVSSDRKLFSTVGGADARIDVLAFTTASAAYTGAVTADKVTYTVAGDFGWVDQDANGTVTTTELQTAIDGLTVAGDKLAIATDRQSITFEKATVGAVSINLTASAAAPATSKVVLNPTDYTVSAKIDYPTSKSSSYTAAGGSWTLNGSQVRVPYMVYGAGRFGIIANVTNHGSKDGNITLDVFAEDGTVIASNYPAGTSKAGSVTSVAPALVALLGSPTTATKFSFQITTNVPANDVLVYAAYTDNTTSERAIVNNDSKVQTK